MELVPASGGVFEVTVDDRLVWSKKARGEFPDEEKLLEGLRQGD